MKDLLHNLLNSTNERFKNPFIGAFVFAWFVCNWQAIFILLLSNHPVEYRLVQIKTYHSDWQNFYLFPFMVAFLYVIGLPYLMSVFDKFSDLGWQTRKRHQTKQELFNIDQKIKLAQKEYLLEEERSGRRDLAAKNEEIAKLKEQLDSILNLNDDLGIRVEDTVMPIEDQVSEVNNPDVIKVWKRELNEFKISGKVDIFKTFAKEIYKGGFTEDKIISVNMPDYRIFFANELIQHVRNRFNNRPILTLTDKGSFFYRNL